MITFFNNAREAQAVFVMVCGLLVVGCEGYVISDDTKTETVSTKPATPTPTNTTSATEDPIVAPTSTPSVVLNDDPNCALVLKYNDRDLHNDGQVHYLKRVLTSDPFGPANPTCVQYNDTQIGEVTVWKDLSSKGRRVDSLPSDRGIDKIVVWYNYIAAHK